VTASTIIARPLQLRRATTQVSNYDFGAVVDLPLPVSDVGLLV